MIEQTQAKRLEDIPQESHDHVALIKQAPAEDQREFWDTLKSYMPHPNSVEMDHQEITDTLNNGGVKALTARMKEIQQYGDSHKSYRAARDHEQQTRYKKLSKPGGF